MESRERSAAAEMQFYEIVEYDPANFDTYPSVCPTPEDVERRFGFKGGERLLFDQHGSYVGQLTKEVGNGEAGA